ncbi:hypothetical protein ACFVKB_33535 [Rhodococcus sp. NPDC127530]
MESTLLARSWGGWATGVAVGGSVTAVPVAAAGIVIGSCNR